MFRLVVLAAALVCVLGAPRTLQRPRYAPGSRIVGGTEIPITQAPYQLSFEEGQRHICGASIISANWAVTAAHCADGARPSNVRLRSGSAKLQSGGAIHDAVEIIVNEQYDAFNIDYDIALIRVATPFVMSSSTAAIPLTSTTPSTGTASLVSGWGTTSSGGGSLPSNLRGVEVPIVDWASCDSSYAQYGGITRRMLCAGLPQGGKDSCQGDSGGPLQAGGKLVGVVSWGAGCALPNFPGVYSDVASLRAWVKENSGV